MSNKYRNMNKPTRICSASLLLLLACIPVSLIAAPEAEWKAGVAVAAITPAGPLWMAGYAARKGPSQATAQPLHAKALALEDRRSHRCVIITSDLLGFPAAVSEPIAEKVHQRYGLGRDQLVFTSSHTHSGPVIRESLINLDQQRIVNCFSGLGGG
jgi:hypothetical protein